MSIDNGERQVAPTLSGIRRDHRERYEFAARMLPERSRIIDFACGVGYGSKILAEAGHSVLAFDRAPEALAYARAQYDHDRILYAEADANAPPPAAETGIFDAAVCYETIEHLEDPRPLLLALHRSTSRLLASVPNEEVFPYTGQAFHFRHYTRGQFERLLAECGWRVVEWYGQDGEESPVELAVKGRTIVAVAEADTPEQRLYPLGAKTEAPDLKGKHVAILGLGPSVTQYLEFVKRLGGRSKFCDQVWAINALGDVFDCDLIFHMDDVRIQEIRAAANPQSNIAAMLPWLKRSRVPVMTSRAHPDYPALIEFPLEAVVNAHPSAYFNSTAAYAIAWAVHCGVAKMTVFGNDFTYPNAHQAEKGRACVEFWLGIAAARGIKLGMPKTSSLMDALCPQSERFYGYDTVELAFARREGRISIEFTERDSLPSAEEIEARYDHSAHPNHIVAAGSA